MKRLWGFRLYPEMVRAEKEAGWIWVHVAMVVAFCASGFLPIVQFLTGLRPLPLVVAITAHLAMLLAHVRTDVYDRHPVAWSHFAIGVNLSVVAAVVWMTGEVWSPMWAFYGLYVVVLVVVGAPKASSTAMVAATPLAVAAVWALEGRVPLAEAMTSAFPFALVGTMTYLGAGTMADQKRRIRVQADALRAGEALEEERRRIARDLHDILGAAMTEVSLWQDVAASARSDPAALDRARRRMRDAMDELRACVGVLGGGQLDASSLEHLIRARVGGLCEASGCALGLSVEGSGTIPLVVVAELLKVATEAAHNAVRHGRASRLDLALAVGSDDIRLSARDDGAGLGDALAHDGHGNGNGGIGLQTLRHRAEALGGTFTLGDHPEGGAGLEWTVPTSGPPAA